MRDNSKLGKPKSPFISLITGAPLTFRKLANLVPRVND